MSASPKRPQRIQPTPIDSGALENLRYIRSTIEAADTFTTVPGYGCIARGVTALVAVGVDSIPQLTPYWLGIWVAAAIVACATALWFMEQKARAQGLSLRRAVARRFFMTLAPAFVAGAILTAALAGSIDRELMTGYKDSGEHVLPVTIDLMGLLGHTVLEQLAQKESLEALLDEVSNVVFFRQDEVRQLNLDHFEETEIFETIPHRP